MANLKSWQTENIFVVDDAFGRWVICLASCVLLNNVSVILSTSCPSEKETVVGAMCNLHGHSRVFVDRWLVNFLRHLERWINVGWFRFWSGVFSGGFELPELSSQGAFLFCQQMSCKSNRLTLALDRKSCLINGFRFVSPGLLVEMISGVCEHATSLPENPSSPKLDVFGRCSKTNR